MTGDLGTDGGQVHADAQTVLDFWFGLPAEKRFARDDVLDREISSRFGGLRDRVLAEEAAGWRGDPDALLAALILLDQFSRNLHRGSAEAFAADPLALGLTATAVACGWEDRYPPERRVFLYLPLMHSEDAGMQALSVAKYEALGLEENIRFAQAHRDVLARFGRFPGRNAALGRATTAEEQAYLDEGGGW